MDFGDLWTRIRIIVSAAAYLADFSTNVVTLIEYYTYPRHLLRRPFYMLLFTVLLAHTINAVVFKLKLSKQDKPLIAAYFLPLIQFWRMIKALRKSTSLDLSTLEEKITLFGILSVAIETGPSLQIQYDAIYRRSRASDGIHVSVFFYISILSSIASMALNGGLAVVSKAKNVKSTIRRIAVATLAGTHIVTATLLRSFSCSIFVMYELGNLAFFLGVLVGAFLGNFIFFWLVLSSGKLRDQMTLGKCVHALANACISYTSPLYSVVSDSNDNQELGTKWFRFKLILMAVFVHAAPDGLAWFMILARPPPSGYNFNRDMFLMQMTIVQALSVFSVMGIAILDYWAGSGFSNFSEEV